MLRAVTSLFTLDGKRYAEEDFCMNLGLKDKVTIVTAGSEGIGKAAATSMAQEGAKVVICAWRKDVLEAACDVICFLASKRASYLTVTSAVV